MKLGFVTCVELGLSCMKAIYETGAKLDLAISLPDDKDRKKSGRVYIDDFCGQHNIPLLKSRHINDFHAIEAIIKKKIDLLFIIGWSQIVSSKVLNAPKRGVIGMHPTLLPEGRGRASIPWAIIKNLDKTGVTMFKMDKGVDTGKIISQIKIPLTKNISAKNLYEKINLAHIKLIKKTINPILLGKFKLTPQDNTKATLWPGRKPEDGEINLKGSVYEAEKLVRAVTYPYPGAFYYHNGVKQIIWSAIITKDIKIKSKIINVDYLSFKDGFLLIKKKTSIN